MQLRDRTTGSLSVGAELLSHHEQRPQPILSQRRRLGEASGKPEHTGGARPRARQDRNLEYDAVRLRFATAAVRRRVEDSITGYNAPKGSEPIGENRERPGWRERQNRLRLGGFVIRFGIEAARQPTGGDEESPVLSHVQPPRLLDARHQSRARAAGLQPRHSAGSLLSNEQSPFGIEGEPDGPLEPVGHDSHGLIRSDARHSPGKSVGDVDGTVNIHCHAARLEKPACPDTGRCQRHGEVAGHARCVRRGRQEHQETQAHEPGRTRNPRQ